MDERANPLSGRLIIGVALVALGGLWTLDNLGLANAGAVLRWWPILLLLVGLMKLTGFAMEKQAPLGGFLTIIGSLLLLGELDFVHIGFGIIWPLFFIFMGVMVVTRAMRKQGDGPAPGEADADDYVRSFALMGGVDRNNESQAFRGGELTAVMGGVQLDLDGARPASGRVIIDVFAMWGGIEIGVPDDWRVELEASPVMGGVENSARLAPDVEPVGTLVIRGLVVMGGVEVKNSPLNHQGSGVVIRTGRRRSRKYEDVPPGGTVVKDVRVGVTGVEVTHRILTPGAESGATPPNPPAPQGPQ